MSRRGTSASTVTRKGEHDEVGERSPDAGAQRCHCGSGRAQPRAHADFLQRIGRNLSFSAISLPNGVSVQVAGVDDERTGRVEPYARETALKPGNTRKIAQDALKLVWLGKEIGATRLVVALSSEIAARTLLQGNGWMKSAFADLGVEVVIVPVSDATRHALLKAQLSQAR